MNDQDITPTAFVPRPLKVVVIGAGISGIQFAHDVTTRMPKIDLQIFEKNPGLGGTWFENRYPECACDVPAHGYQYSWAPNPSWSATYAPAREICAYLNAVVDRHDLRKFMRFNRRCISAVWSEDNSQWTAVFRDEHSREESVVRSDILIYAVGRLNNYQMPLFEGRERFQGPVVHTAAWPDSLDVRGKRVAVLGNGASGIQCVAGLQSKAGVILNLAQHATWLGPPPFIEKRKYSDDEKAHFRISPPSYQNFRVDLEKKMLQAFAPLWKDTNASRNLRSKAESYLKSKVEDPKLREKLTPNFTPACRRWTPGEQYISTLQQPYVHLINDRVGSLTECGIKTQSGIDYECDVIVCATGFEPYNPRFPVVGRDGVTLTDCWGSDGSCESYMSAMVAHFPNMFVFHPPNCPINGSAFPGIERTSDYIVRILARLQTDRLRSVSVKPAAQREFNQWVQSRMPEMVWSDNCNSWYKNKTGKIIVPWPGTTNQYYAATEVVRWEDFDLVFEDPGQKYRSFGNGVTMEGFAPESVLWVQDPEFLN
ncbi:hypothetical protein BDV25DRAFT_129391 [Aspergillus avenaceus]|uniref:FAD/NAD(P)-binding domain-containing protein n=1 Tax=Aspergillus avenaceus TaxID=36643 RepID=A0A5N6TWF9_ASPAV|nr:hypothetical protein BDV25DRAFT_129391 [Aspergillus avenaceus]